MRLVVHAGFPKCGSSSIQRELHKHQAALARRSVFLFGEDLVIRRRVREWEPFWKAAEVLSDRSQHPTIASHVAAELRRLAARVPTATAVISAEVLSKPGSERAFCTIDEQFDTNVVFYFRPQSDWIPSAWQQWPLKNGIALKDFLDESLAAGRPEFLARIHAWSTALPKAALTVRLLPQAVAENGSPAGDFFRVLGLDDFADPMCSRVNPSPDYAILHLLSKNPWLFDGEQDRRPFDFLTRSLPEAYLTPNIRMLSAADEIRVAEHFRDENLSILRRYMGLSEVEATRTYEMYLRPSAAERSYQDMEEADIIYRSLGIILAMMMKRDREQRSIFRRPYWKVPWRALKRITGSRS
jgi:hypothetical protein